MTVRIIILALIAFFPCFTHGDQQVDHDSPEGWAMAFMTASAQNLGQSPPYAVSRTAKNWFWRVQG